MRKTASQPQVVVSLTSFPAAISYAEGAVRSLLRGSVLPDKLVLYVTLSQFAENEMPESLLQPFPLRNTMQNAYYQFKQNNF